MEGRLRDLRLQNIILHYINKYESKVTRILKFQATNFWIPNIDEEKYGKYEFSRNFR